MASPPTHGSSNLIRAARSGNLSLIKGYVEFLNRRGDGAAKVLMQITDKNGETLLHHAAAGGRTLVCKYLIETLKFDVNVKNAVGNTPLHIAAEEDQYLTSAYLLDHGANPNAQGFKEMTPLHCAAVKGRKKQLQLLISKGAEVNGDSSVGSPLHCAAGRNMKDALKILLEHGANPNSVSFKHKLLTPLMLATVGGHVDCVRLLLKNKADPNLKKHELMTPLTLAASEGHIEIIKCLLKAGANPNDTDFYDFTPIELAAMKRHLAIVIALFPKTTRLPKLPVWSVEGILDYVFSVEADHQQTLKMEEKFVEVKAKGAEAVKRNDYLDGVLWYTKALDLRPMDAVTLSNRSLCWARLNDGDLALKDAKACIKRRRDWPKAYYRAGVAWRVKKDLNEAAKAFLRGLKRDPKNKELQDAYREVMAEQGETVMTDLNGLFNEACTIEDENEYEDDNCPNCSRFDCEC